MTTAHSSSKPLTFNVMRLLLIGGADDDRALLQSIR